jgi:hypothetical protein
MTRSRVTPEMLERSFSYKLTINDLRGGRYADGLASAVTTMSVERTADMADVRWGITCFDQSGQRIVAFYFDASGRHGAVDDLPVSFKGDLYRWLDQNFSRVFK